MSISNENQDKYYKNFEFFFNRSCFRTMTKFYKEKFDKFYDKKVANLKKDNFSKWQETQSGGVTAMQKSDMDVIVKEFID